MKRFVALTVVCLLVFAMSPISAFAAESGFNAEAVIYFDDGSYIVIETVSVDTRALSSKTGKRTYVYYNSGGTEEWRAVLQGTYSYDGTTVTCTASICTVSITDSDWYVISKTTSKSGGTAYATLTMGTKVLGVTVNRETINMSLTCDKNGNLS